MTYFACAQPLLWVSLVTLRKNSISSVSMMETSGKLHYNCLAGYEKETGFDASEPSG